MSMALWSRRKGASPTELPAALYNELKEQLIGLAKTKAFTINAITLRPIALAFVIKKLGANAIRPGSRGFICGLKWLQQLAKDAGLRWRKPYGDARKHPADAKK